jgi:hypothetical protein
MSLLGFLERRHRPPLHTKVINAAVKDATHVLDGLLYGWMVVPTGFEEIAPP